MIQWGISAGTHDASISVIQNNKILFASHSERFSGIKNDAFLNPSIIDYALQYGEPAEICWYENPYLKAARKIYAGQKRVWFNPREYLKKFGLTAPVVYATHHQSHAAGGYYTSPFPSAATLVMDAIGEFTTSSIWGDGLKKLWSSSYPRSVGLFYSAMTARIGLKPNEDEYILMGMSAYGDPWRFFDSIKAEICDAKSLHRGCMWWNPDLKEEDYFDVAAATQMIYELIFRKMLEETQKLTRNSNLVFSGGCALNCLANRHIRQYFDNHWIMPNPGDAGSSIGAVAARNKTRIEWDTPYLGYDIKGAYPIDDMLRELKDNKIVGVANGKAEFGPRSLGNRSLLADPRGQEMKVLVNKIKKRQEFRPFAPVILQEDVHKYFKVNRRFKSPYMQEIVECRNPELFPAIVHKDGTSRIQTVNSEQHSGLAQLLRRWKAEGNHPILLNTSLNIKGQPMVNTEVDGKEFTEKYGVKVCVG